MPQKRMMYARAENTINVMASIIKTPMRVKEKFKNEFLEPIIFFWEIDAFLAK